MPRGASDIADLRLETISKFVTTWMSNFTPVLSSLFPASTSASSTIKWESSVGGRGMAPFKAPGQPTPTTYPLGKAKHSAEAAFWGEKMYFDEEFLNNLRQPGTDSTYQSAQATIAKEISGLTNRVMRRKEFMFAKMLADGSFSYTENEGTKLSVDYSLPSSHQVSLATDAKWSTGTSRDILLDIKNGKKVISDDCGGKVDYAMCCSTVLYYLASDPSIQTLLQKSTFGMGDLFQGAKNGIVGVNPNVIASLLDIPNLLVYDEIYEVSSYLTAAVTADSTTSISVANPADFSAGETLRLMDVSAGTYEDEPIASVDAEAGTVTVSTAPSTSYKAGEDIVIQKSYFIPATKFIMMASRVDGMPVAEYKQAPYGNNRVYGVNVKRWETEDPEGVFIRVEDKGLPVLYQRDALYQLTI